MSLRKSNFEITVKTFQGLEEVLSKEIKQLGVDKVQIHKRAVSFQGNNELLYKANLHLRTAIKILKPIARFRAKNDYHLYGNVQKIDWSALMSHRDTLFVDSTVFSDYFRHSKYVIHKTKDAIVDQFRKKAGKRPDIDMQNPTLRVNVHILNDQCTISLDSSGNPLNQRGYRAEQTEAPINEVLAAGLILLSGWKRDCNFIDPMCGSGTIPIEACLYAYNMAPNILRDHFGFMNWKDFDKRLWLDIQHDAKSMETTFPHKILGYDKSPRAIRIAKKSMIQAQLQGKVNFEVRDFMDLTRPGEEKKGIMIMNPPYGERIERVDINDFYTHIGDRLKQHFTGYEACIISANIDAMKNVGLKTSFRMHMNNGGLKSKYHKYRIFAGSNKDNLL